MPIMSFNTMYKTIIILIFLFLSLQGFSQNENRFIALKNEKKGILDITNRKIILTFQYDNITSYGDYIMVRKGNETTLLDFSTLENLIPSGYEYAGGYGQGSDNNIIVKKTSSGKYGIMNIAGNILQPCIYSGVKRETAGFDTYRFSTDTNCVILDSRLNYKMSCEEYNLKDRTYFIMRKEIKDENGKPKYQYAAKNRHTNERVTPWLDYNMRLYKDKYFEIYNVSSTGGEYNLGICSLTGDILVAPENKQICKRGDSDYAGLWKNQKMAYYNIRTEQMVTPYIYNNYTYSETSTGIRYPDYINVQKDTGYGVLDLKTGEEVVPCVHNKAHYHSWTGGYLLYKDGKSGMFDCEQGILAVPCQYDHIGINYLEDGEHYVYIVVDADKCGVISKEGKMILPVEYDNISHQGAYLVLTKDSVSTIYDPINRKEKESFRVGENLYPISDRIMVVSDGDNKGIANCKTGQLIVPCEYSVIEWMDNSYYYTYKEETGSANIVDVDTGKELIDFQVSHLSWGYEDLISFEKDNKYGVYNVSTKQLVLSNKYENLWIYKPNIFVARFDGKYGILNNKGKTLVPFEYDELSPLQEIDVY